MPAAPVELTAKGIRYRPVMAGRRVDVVLGDHRVWSCSLPPGGRRVTWPPSLRERLRGRSSGRIDDSGTHDVLWSGEIRWPGTGAPQLTDDHGRGLRVDKWGGLRPSFETGTDIRPEVAASADTVLRVLRAAGLDAFIVGGTLLGAVRDGEILPHDDDADLAYLSRHTHPSDLIMESARIQRLLGEQGFRVIRHSWAHLQVLSDGGDYYVDIFTAFYKNGWFHEPIHVRAPDMDTAILPLSERTLNGIRMPAPHDAEAWLAACYGPSWRTPDPSFRFETPLETQRRFHAWFGSFHLGIDEWSARYASATGGHESDLLRRHILDAGDTVIDLGSGGGEDLEFYRGRGLAAVGSDSAHNAPAVLTGATHVNLVEYLAGFEFLRSSLATARGGRVVLAANHLLACQDPRGRRTLLELMRFALRHGARVITADYEALGRYSPRSPRTWHLDWPTREDEARAAGLECTLLERSSHVDEDGIRRAVAVVEYRRSLEGGSQ